MNNLPTNPATAPQSFLERAALMPDFDVNKFKELVTYQREEDQRRAEAQWNDAFAAAMAEIAPIATDANNPQTRSKYATYAAVDRALRPIYTKHGLAPSFTTETIPGDVNAIMVVGYLTKGAFTRRYQIPMPIETKGPKGQEYTTRTFATLAAASYGNRKLLMSMFGISVDDEPVRREPPPTTQRREREKPFELVDPTTGEVITTPTTIPVTRDDYRGWGEKFVGVLNNLAQSIEEQDRWIELNADTLDKIEKLKPAWFEAFMRAIGNAKAKYLDPQ